MDVGRHIKAPLACGRFLIKAALLTASLMTLSMTWAGAANYSYDSLGRITQVVYTDGSTTTTVNYSYDATGNRSAVVTTRSP